MAGFGELPGYGIPGSSTGDGIQRWTNWPESNLTPLPRRPNNFPLHTDYVLDEEGEDGTLNYYSDAK